MATGNSINANSSGIQKYDGAGTFSGITVTNHATLVGAASNGITSVLQGAGQLLIGTTAGDPSAATLTAGTGVSISSVSGAVTVNAIGAGLTWSTVTGTTQAAAVNNGYIANNAGLVTVTLPAVSAVGDMVWVTGENNATGWKVAQNAGNTIFMGSGTSTAGTGGSLASTATHDAVLLMCITANANWQVMNSMGNITIV